MKLVFVHNLQFQFCFVKDKIQTFFVKWNFWKLTEKCINIKAWVRKSPFSNPEGTKLFHYISPNNFTKSFVPEFREFLGLSCLKKKTFFHELTFTLLNRKVLYEALKVDKSTQFCSCKWHWSKKHFNCNVSDTFRELNVTDDTFKSWE